MSSELRFVNWVRFFAGNCVIKWVIFLDSFCRLWDFLLKDMKLKKTPDDVHWNVWTNLKTLHARNNIFKKKELQIWDFESFSFCSKISFLGAPLGHFSQCFFLIFCGWATMVANIFTQPSHHRKASYGPVDAWNQALLFTRKTSFSSRFFFNIPEIYVQIKNRLNTSLKPELLFIFYVWLV